ncbi:MAG: IS1634 family transposase [Pseudonocardiales bacterium]|nr:IS1634 family transposase [Chloroflexota bacterium]PZS29112.1 MAG: IS1634 family transposase [Pseudonocardiales bacterium]
MSEPNDPNEFALVSRTLGGLPIVNAVLARLGLPALLAGALPAGDARVKVSSAAAVGLVVTNLVLGREPLYGLGEWAARYDPALLGLTAQEVGVLNDDRVGRALEALFDADRASLLTSVVLRAISEFEVDTSQLHNDSTSISVHGAYRDAVGTVRGGKPTPMITFGHSKDHRPDLKQLVWILTVSADGAVPLAYRLADGNTVDDPTHVPTWDGLAGLLGRSDFLYVADSKLCSRQAMGHIDSRGGRFVTVLPRSRAEDGAFRDHLQTHNPPWTEAARRPGSRLGEPDEVYSTTPAPLPSAEGYRIVWVHSTAKASRDAAARQARIEAGVAAIEALDAKLAGPRSRFKTHVTVEQAATGALTSAHADRWVTATVTETLDKTYKQERRGRPGPATRYREISTTRFGLHSDIARDRISYDAASDGCFPLITNDRNLTDAQVLAAYRYQPNLERRHHLLKSVQDAAPVLLHNPARIAALFCCQFLALLVAALIEREVRTGMRRAALHTIGLYPEFRDCTAPSTERILEIFATVARHHLHHNGNLMKTFEPELTAQQLQVLDLMGIAPTAYTQLA